MENGGWRMEDGGGEEVVTVRGSKLSYNNPSLVTESMDTVDYPRQETQELYLFFLIYSCLAMDELASASW